MWVIIFMVAFVVPIIIIGSVAAWREKQFDKKDDQVILVK